MPKSAAVLSSSLQSRWERWKVYFIFLLLSIFLLLGEQSGGFRFLWDIGRITTIPGMVVIKHVQSAHRSVQQQIFWRQKVVSRLAALESERAAQDVRLAELTQQIEFWTASSLHATISGKVEQDFWQPSRWEGIPGAWQVRSGCLDGIQVGDPIITPQGVLLGNVSHVFATYSSVTSWDTPGWRTPAKVGTSSANALAESTISEPMITGLRWPTDVAIGASILTAGSGNTPRNLFVGTVETLEPQQAFGEVKGRVRIPVELHRTQDVLVPRGAGETCNQN